MKKLVLVAAMAATFMTACSKDDEPKCESCTSEAGNKFQICDTGDGTYELTGDGITVTIDEGDLEGAVTPKSIVESACESDSGNIQF